MLLKKLNNLFKFFFLLLIGIYRSVGSAWLGGACRFEPSCSEYCAQAARYYPFYKALYLSLKRVSRCRPGGGFGYDPLPLEKSLNHQYKKCCGGLI